MQIGSFNKLRLVKHFVEADLNLDKYSKIIKPVSDGTSCGSYIFLRAEEEMLQFH